MTRLARIRRGEEGVAIIVAVVLLSALVTLSTLVLTMGTHTDRATGRGRSWTQALHAAEAGVQAAIARLESTDGGFSGAMTGQTAEGSYCVTVTHGSRSRYTLDATGVAPADETGNCQAAVAGIGAARRLQVVMAPPVSFKYALFSFTSVETKNNDAIFGDIWANQNVTVDEGDTITGSATAATGWIRLRQGSTVTGNATSGGFNPEDNDRSIHLDSNAVIQGNAIAASAQPASEANCRADHINWKVRLDGPAALTQVLGDVTSCGPETGEGQVGGTITAGVYTAAPATKSLPTFTYSAANYDDEISYGSPETASPTAVSEFQSYVNSHVSNFSGTFYINQAPPVNQDVRIDLTGVTIRGDTTIITNTPIFTNGNTDNVSDAIVVLVSTYQPPTGSTCDVNIDASECSVHLKNNFQVTTDPVISCNTAVVVYAPYGPVAVKNNAEQCGTIYADNIQIKNNQTLVYDARVDQIVGFGEVTLEVERWVELSES